MCLVLAIVIPIHNLVYVHYLYVGIISHLINNTVILYKNVLHIELIISSQELFQVPCSYYMNFLSHTISPPPLYY